MEKREVKNPQTFWKKIENFWFYHKWHLLSGILIVAMTVIGVRSCVQKESIDLYVLYMLNGAYSTETNEELALRFEDYIEDIDGDGEKRVQIITVSFSEVLHRTDRAQEATLTRLVGQIASGPALFYIFDDANFEALQAAKVDIFASLDILGVDSKFLEEERFNASKSGFFKGLEGFEDREKDLYFGLRQSDNISKEDSRFSQIEQSEKTLKNIISAFD